MSDQLMNELADIINTHAEELREFEQLNDDREHVGLPRLDINEVQFERISRIEWNRP